MSFPSLIRGGKPSAALLMRLMANLQVISH
jgi:hypothetical protein